MPSLQSRMSRGPRQWQIRIGVAFCTIPSIFFGAFSILFGLACLLGHLLVVHHAPAPSKTLLAKFLAVG